jgi:hypothetical protein
VSEGARERGSEGARRRRRERRGRKGGREQIKKAEGR